ncbi:hypothetical protein [Streptomyces sp. NPDC058855]|uniref:hypothetical protein n=1 Tax=Streptomyces sp. NPDC058855 TaxID=3346651 RepID=UPI0036B96A71
MTGSNTNLPPIGAIVLDTARNHVGRVMGAEGPYLQLRPLGGGREWDVEAAHLHPLTGAELLSALVAEANARSRRRRSLGNGTPSPDLTESGPAPST